MEAAPAKQARQHLWRFGLRQNYRRYVHGLTRDEPALTFRSSGRRYNSVATRRALTRNWGIHLCAQNDLEPLGPCFTSFSTQKVRQVRKAAGRRFKNTGQTRADVGYDHQHRDAAEGVDQELSGD